MTLDISSKSCTAYIGWHTVYQKTTTHHRCMGTFKIQVFIFQELNVVFYTRVPHIKILSHWKQQMNCLEVKTLCRRGKILVSILWIMSTEVLAYQLLAKIQYWASLVFTRKMYSIFTQDVVLSALPVHLNAELTNRGFIYSFCNASQGKRAILFW